MLRAVIFDMDGVISDTEGLHVQVERALLGPHGIDPAAPADGRYSGLSDREFFRAILADHGITADVEELIARKRRAMLECPAAAIAPIPGAIALIRGLRRHALRLGVASASPAAFVERVLDCLGIRQEFDAVVSADEVARGKPEPDVFLFAAERLGAEPSACVVVEDAISGVMAARRAGMRCVALVSGTRGDAGYPADLVVTDLRRLTPALLLAM